MMPRSKSYYRQQRRVMMQIITRSQSFWQAEAARWHRMADELAAIIAEIPATRTKAHEVLESFQEWADAADAIVKRDTRELKKWRAKRV